MGSGRPTDSQETAFAIISKTNIAMYLMLPGVSEAMQPEWEPNICELQHKQLNLCCLFFYESFLDKSRGVVY